MKKSVVFTFIVLYLLPVTALAQFQPAGNWLGTLEAGSAKLRLVFHITGKPDSMKAKMDSPDQGVKDISVPAIKMTGDSLSMSLGMASFKGRVANDTTIEGVWMQSGQRFPLTIYRTELKERSQTPIPPFPYLHEEVTFANKDKSITYGATITAPKDNRKHPALLLVTGSGQQDRDGTILGHKPFAVIADYLTRRGYVVLRVDDRGRGKTNTGGDLNKATTADFARDAAVELDYLKTRPEVDVKRIGLLGHSEGGAIATILASQRSDVNFIVSMAGPGVTGAQVLIAQNEAILTQRGFDSATRKEYLKLYASYLNASVKEESKQALLNALTDITAAWRTNTPEEIVQKTTGIKDEKSEHAFISMFAQQLNLPWFRHFIAYDPAPLMRKISCKVLVVNGGKDVQVTPEPNLAGWHAMLKSSKAKRFDIVALPGLNHLFQECTQCDVEEYGELEQTISPAALQVVGDWLAREVK